ncbi:MAG: PAS domain S-box protein [Pseudomonadota bacterium]|nr:PAS domain S-box protein [Pseudomonadota bacterium]
MPQDTIRQQNALIAQLRESEARFRGAFETAAIGMALVSLEGRWLDVNASLCEIVGYARDELLVTDFQTLTHPDDLDADLSLLQQLLAGEIQSYRMEKRYFHKTGRLVWVLLSVSLVRDVEGEPVHFVSQIEDVTQSKNDHAALHRKNQELEQFAAVVSHDLKAPLRGVRGFAQLLRLKLGAALAGEASDYLDMIDMSIERAGRLVHDLLALARVGESAEPERVSMQSVINQLLRDLQATLEETGARVQVQTDSLSDVWSHQTGVRQLMQNLLTNAIKFRAPERPLTIDIACRQSLNEAIFEITDNGRGIQPRHAERVFRVFERLHGDEIEGTGIGLAICKKVVEDAGGRIWIQPNPQHGATVVFTMPAANPGV